tara:strand:+ start:133 stop:270 length:138 start_codon:yes stop_codon:yes gene_type:complete
MPLPFQCIYCGKHVKEPMNGICEECKKEDKDFIQYRDTGDENEYR